MQFQISSRRGMRKGDTWVNNIKVFRKVFSKQFCLIKCRGQHTWTTEQRNYSRFNFVVKSTIGNLLKVPRVKGTKSTVLLVQMKNQWRSVRLDLIPTMTDIYINSNLSSLATKFTTSSRDTEFKYILQRNISQIIKKISPISRRIVKSYMIK